MSTNTKLAEALPKLPMHPEPHTMTWTALEARVIEEYGLACARAALAATPAAAEPARLTDEQRIDWLCEEAVYHCGQWQVVFDSDKDSFIDAMDEMAAIAHGIGASEGEKE